MKTIFRSMFIAAAVVLAAGCGNTAKKAETQVVAQEVVPTVAVETVSAREVPQTATYTSTVQAYVKNNIAPQMSGRISKINVEIGDFVKKGQVLAEIDKSQLIQAQLQLQNQEVELSRLKTLYQSGAVSKSDFDAVELAYKVAQTQVANLEENTILRSPIDGVVTARNYDAGDMYAMTSPIYVVEQIIPVKLLVAISESDYTKVKKGDSIEITADAIPGKTFYGKVEKIYPTVDPATRTFVVEVVVANAYKTLRPGMFARVTVNFGTNKNVVIPDQAVQKLLGSGDRYVYIYNPADSTVRYSKVELGRRLDTEFEVYSGVKSGEIVVTKGHLGLTTGCKAELVK